MILREAGSDFLLIRQDDHARLSGQLAALMGNDRFAPPDPYALVVKAIELHDCGWPLHDDAPTLDAAGLPRNVFEMPPQIATAIWTASTEGAMAVDPYVGLLVSLHGLHLSSFMLSSGATGPSRHSPHEVFAINQFQHNQIEVQEQLRKALGLRIDQPLKLGLAEPGRSPGEDALRRNYLLLKALDALSLNACFGEPRIPNLGTLVPKLGEPPVSWRVEMRSRDQVGVTPWPFSETEFDIEVPVYRIPAQPLESKAEYQRRLEQSEREVVRIQFALPR